MLFIKKLLPFIFSCSVYVQASAFASHFLGSNNSDVEKFKYSWFHQLIGVGSQSSHSFYKRVRYVRSYNAYEYMSQDIMTEISAFIPLSEIPILELVCKAWHQRLNATEVWEQRVKRIPGYERVGFERDYKKTLKKIITPQFIVFGCLKEGLQEKIHTCAEAISPDGDRVTGYHYKTLPSESNKLVYSSLTWMGEEGLQFTSPWERDWKEYQHPITIESADGKVRIERNNEFSFTQREDGQREHLGSLNGGRWTLALAMSRDGKIIVGSAENGKFSYNAGAFIWTQELGIMLLQTILRKVIPERCILEKAAGISEDGMIIVGDLTYFEKDFTDIEAINYGWRAYIPRFDILVKEGFYLQEEQHESWLRRIYRSLKKIPQEYFS